MHNYDNESWHPLCLYVFWDERDSNEHQNNLLFCTHILISILFPAQTRTLGLSPWVVTRRFGNRGFILWNIRLLTGCLNNPGLGTLNSYNGMYFYGDVYTNLLPRAIPPNRTYSTHPGFASVFTGKFGDDTDKRTIYRDTRPCKLVSL